MRTKPCLASTLRLAFTLALAGLGTTGATAHSQAPQAQGPQVQDIGARMADDHNGGMTPAADGPVNTEDDFPLAPAASLAELVDKVPVPAKLSPDVECLASAIYFEAKSESLAGQLAVGRVIVARTVSGHFPRSYCGVVLQRAQFSFVRGGAIPGIDRSSNMWQRVVKIALIAHRGAWKSPAEGALFFHAARVRAASGKVRIARVDHQIFYR